MSAKTLSRLVGGCGRSFLIGLLTLSGCGASAPLVSPDSLVVEIDLGRGNELSELPCKIVVSWPEDLATDDWMVKEWLVTVFVGVGESRIITGAIVGNTHCGGRLADFDGHRMVMTVGIEHPDAPITELQFACRIHNDKIDNSVQVKKSVMM